MTQHLVAPRHVRTVLFVLLAAVRCSADTVDLDGLPCGNEPCVDGWDCHPETLLCARSVAVACDGSDAICPSAVTTGDACSYPGSFINCDVAVLDCSAGCRTCTSERIWSECSPSACATCSTFYRDDDGDGVGQSDDTACLCEPASPYSATSGGDCDDDNEHCTDDCTDGDDDAYCVDFDCNDGNVTCTEDCSTCPPTSLELSVQTTPPFNAQQSITLTIDLGSYTRDASEEITCSSSRHSIVGPITFTGQPALGSLGLVGTQWIYLVAPASPADEASCANAGDYVRLRDQRNASLSLSQPLDVSGYEQLQLTFRAAVDDGYVVGDALLVQSCCGEHCSLTTTATLLPDTLAATNACSLQTVSLSEGDCGTLDLSWPWNQRSVDVGLDDIEITALITIPPVSMDSPGHYVTTLTPGFAGTFEVTCRWYNASMGAELIDTASITVE